ncbi:hypothetical protein LXJ15735_16840 [Lacrimispora xylanolytica]|jgi:hypothetical protein|uniref:DUF2935 domain-containing protein n=1 Tax=Lacrimispora xylanolytica TaxID=29375 RepID=A0ABY7AFG6_9FIRM|nr:MULTISPECIES: DUF2935 domain-containing protein [Clostridia]WAJ25331.1 DUF2935 domain-containing protein [Lacrimispora xylanolytica]
MIDQQQYVILSLELHLFFGRIMKEHSIFLEAGFTPANPNFSNVADQFKEQFENVLYHAVVLGNGIITPNVVSSGEIVTEYTLGTEQKTQNFTGIVINQDITRMEADLYGLENPQITSDMVQQVRQLNTQTIPLLDGLIEFKTRVLNEVLACNMFTMNYPLLIDHILREANMYRSQLAALESGEYPYNDVKDTELFWDQIMMEHALFIRGLLDPTEGELINTSNNFAHEYADLLEMARNATDATMEQITGETLEETLRYQNFKEAGTSGISECKIRSIILPLLGDHVLREANHFIRLLNQFR